MNLRFLPAGNPAFWLISAPFFLLLFLLSIFSVSLIVEKLLLLRRWRCRNRGLPALAGRLLQQGELQQLGHLLAVEIGAEAILLRSSFDFIRHEVEGRPNGLRNLRLDPLPVSVRSATKDGGSAEDAHPAWVLPPASRTEMQNRLERLGYAVETCIAKLGMRLEKHCNLFHLIANIATLLGLLGTVSGMIYAFWSGALEGGNRLSGGIAQALLTTAGGLIVAIPAIAAQHLFLNAANWRVYGLEQLGDEILRMEQKRLEIWMEHTRRTETMHSLQTAPSATGAMAQAQGKPVLPIKKEPKKDFPKELVQEPAKHNTNLPREGAEAVRQNPDSAAAPQPSQGPQCSQHPQPTKPLREGSLSQKEHMNFVVRLAQMERQHQEQQQHPAENLAPKVRARKKPAPSRSVPHKMARKMTNMGQASGASDASSEKP